MAATVFRTCIAVLATALVASAAAAQATPPLSPPPDDEITVTGSRARPRAIEKAARAVTPPGDLYHTPLPRYQAPVCPGVVGMPADFAAEMTARIRATAERAGIGLAPSHGCKANLLVIVVPDGRAALRAMRGRGPWPFSPIAPAELRDLAADPGLKDLAAEPGPAHAWVSTETRDRYGEALSGGGNTGAPETLRSSDSLSRLSPPARKDIVASVVVIDRAAVQGMPAAQVADYAAMRGLVRTRPPGQPGAVGTILSLFDAGAVAPPELTRFDLAYLRAIYGSTANIAGISKVAQVAHEMKKAASRE